MTSRGAPPTDAEDALAEGSGSEMAPDEHPDLPHRATRGHAAIRTDERASSR